MLTKSFIFFAQIDPNVLDSKPSKGFSLNLKDSMLIFGLALILALLLFLWAYLSRRRRRSHGLSRSSMSPDHPDREVVDSSSGKMRYRKKRRRHPDHLPRNPSLGETGGLPPPRPEDSAGTKL